MARRSATDEAAIEQKLAELDALPADRAAQSAPLTAALSHKHYRVVAKAARLAADKLAYELVQALRAAYPRFLEKPVKADPNCFAKKAIVRALVALDYEDAEFFSAGLQLKQMEPVWGGTVDTAADVRASCAMGLVASGNPRALVAITQLLYDPEPDARVGAVRAAAYGKPARGRTLLRAKVLARDAEPAILGECFTALLSVEPEESLAFVATHPEGSRRRAARARGARDRGIARAGCGRDPAQCVERSSWWREEEFRLALIRGAARAPQRGRVRLAIVDRSRGAAAGGGTG